VETANAVMWGNKKRTVVLGDHDPSSGEQ
jgi:hypothetical protein